MFSLCATDRIESPHPYNLLYRVARTIVCVAVCAKYAAEICFQPMLFGSLKLIASFVDSIEFYRAGNGDLHAHVQPRKGIVAAINVSPIVKLVRAATYQYNPETMRLVLS